MTQIVENTMVQSPDDSTSFRWLETEKLLDMVAFEFHARSAVAEPRLQIDLSRAPALIWGDESLLATGLGHLLDWAAGVADGPPIVVLRVESGERAVVLRVSSLVATATPDGQQAARDLGQRDPSAGETLPRRLAAAEAAANALGGVLMRPDGSTDDRHARVELPQPRRFE
jgi:hypothetical protein